MGARQGRLKPKKSNGLCSIWLNHWIHSAFRFLGCITLPMQPRRSVKPCESKPWAISCITIALFRLNHLR